MTAHGTKGPTRRASLRQQLTPKRTSVAKDFSTAQTAYNDAVSARPGKLITLRQKTRVIEKSRQSVIGGQAEGA